MRGALRYGFVAVVVGAIVYIAAPARAARCGDVAGDAAALESAWQDLTTTCGCASAPDDGWKPEFRSFVSCVRDFAVRAVLDESIRPSCRSKLIAGAKRSTCARPSSWTTCCSTNRNARVSCKVRKSTEDCVSTPSRFAELGSTETCLDACADASGPLCWADSECDDQNGCTIDWCEPADGCHHVAIDGCVPGGGGSGGTSCSGTGTATHGLDAQEQILLDLINSYRSSQRAKPARICTSLNRSAQDHANDMRDRKYFAHQGANGSEFWERACDAGYLGGCGPSTYMGEIIAGYDSTASGAMNQWLGSPGHEAIMAASYYGVIGIGHACGGPLGNYWVVDFGGADEASCN